MAREKEAPFAPSHTHTLCVELDSMTLRIESQSLLKLCVVTSSAATPEPRCGMERVQSNTPHGSCDKIVALLVFTPGGPARQVLLRWTGVSPAYSHAELNPPRRTRYSWNEEENARIAADIAALPQRSLPAPCPRQRKHGINTDKAIRNARLPKAVLDTAPGR